MKFAKELEQDLVPEWRIKYLNYKAGKKHVKAITRATTRINATPRTPAQPSPLPRNKSIYGATSPFTPRNIQPSSLRQHTGNEELCSSPAPFDVNSRPQSGQGRETRENSAGALKKTQPVPISGQKAPNSVDEAAQYGSFVATPPARQTFELPDPAIATPLQGPSGTTTPQPNHISNENIRPGLQRDRSASMVHPANAYEVGERIHPSRQGTFASLRQHIPPGGSVRPFMRRMFSIGTPMTLADSRRMDVDMVAVDQVKHRQKDFFKWMDKELLKVETFYKEKEDEAGNRLIVLREQLHEMRNRRIEEVAAAQHTKALRREEERNIFDFGPGHSKKDDGERPNSRDNLNTWLDPIERAIEHAKSKVIGPHPGANSKALQKMQESPAMLATNQAVEARLADEGRDYVRRHYDNDVPYRTAKRKLKLALQEFYRGMELLKSYALMNRTAFRKINKKYDKAVDAHPPLRYMSEKVNKAWFVQSDILDGHLHAVEDLYARYFERGNHKIAVGKLRSSTDHKRDQSQSAFKNGILIGTGAVFAIQGLVYGIELLYDPDPVVSLQTSYLLQIYAGYFLALYLFCWFCLDCSIWTRHKINYQFVFEFDPRHNLDWRQLSEFPSFLVLVFGLFVWLNFTRYGSPEMYIYYPVLLMFVTAVFIFFPGPYIFYRSRWWFVYSHWRLVLAGLYPVEFRDFFLGDMYCSLTYMMANIELFFCVYANHWNDPPQCNSSHSRLLGFFSALPGIWRALQCLRRYHDTRNVFPHLVNCGKYLMTIMYYITLSIYRIDHATSNLALFATFATLNAIYTSVWDLLMDWSLLQPNANMKFLRDVRGYKNPFWYYAAMILDPILRCNWIFYAIYTHDLQHNSLASFLVAFSEVTRRGIWVIFRVENEHCSNVARFKASRDVPLPYKLHADSEDDSAQAADDDDEMPELDHAQTTGTAPTGRRSRADTGATLEAQPTGIIRHRINTSQTIKNIIANAHTQDFEKKRKPGAGDGENAANRRKSGENEEIEEQINSSDEDSESEEDILRVLDAEGLLRERRQPNGNDGDNRDS